MFVCDEEFPKVKTVERAVHSKYVFSSLHHARGIDALLFFHGQIQGRMSTRIKISIGRQSVPEAFYRAVLLP